MAFMETTTHLCTIGLGVHMLPTFCLHGTLWDFELTRSGRSGGFEHSFFGITREPYWLSVACLRCYFRRYPPLENP